MFNIILEEAIINYKNGYNYAEWACFLKIYLAPLWAFIKKLFFFLTYFYFFE